MTEKPFGSVALIWYTSFSVSLLVNQDMHRLYTMYISLVRKVCPDIVDR